MNFYLYGCGAVKKAGLYNFFTLICLKHFKICTSGGRHHATSPVPIYKNLKLFHLYGAQERYLVAINNFGGQKIENFK